MKYLKKLSQYPKIECPPPPLNYTLNEIIFNRTDQRQKKTVNKLQYLPHQLFEVLHKIDIILGKVQVANTPSNQHSSGVELPKLCKN